MRVRVGYAYKSFEVELPMNDADLNAYMKMKGCEDVILNCKLLEVMDAGNPLHWFEDLVVSMDAKHERRCGIVRRKRAS